MDNSWYMEHGFSGMGESSNIPFVDMLNMTDCSQAQTRGEHPEPPVVEQAASGSQRRKGATKGKQNNFSIDEDRILVSCWLNVSLDPITGAGQRKASFWKTIERNYNEQKSAAHPIRTLRSLEGRWSEIKEQANKFEAHYNSVLSENHSGYNDMDKISAALTLYNSIERKPMSTIHCWEILRKEPKWLDLQQKATQPQNAAPIDLTGSAPSGGEGSESQTRPLKRPIGRDAAKAAKRASSCSSDSHSSSEYSTLFSDMHIRRMEFMKDRDDAFSIKMDKLVTIQEEAINIKKQQFQLKQLKQQQLQLREDERIMAIDLSTCNPGQRLMYEALQRQILERRTGGSSG